MSRPFQSASKPRKLEERKKEFSSFDKDKALLHFMGHEKLYRPMVEFPWDIMVPMDPSTFLGILGVSMIYGVKYLLRQCLDHKW